MPLFLGLFAFTISFVQPISLPEGFLVSSMANSVDYRELPEIQAKSYLLGDVNSGTIIAAHHERASFAMASLTKLMTAVVALEHFSPDEVVTISPNAAQQEGASLHLYASDQIKVSELVSGALIRSGNDAAMALAEHAPGGESQFITWMNEKAEALGMNQTHFMNSIGFDDPKHYTTAADLFLLARYAVETHELIDRSAKLRETFVHSEQGREYKAESTNQLLGTWFMDVEGLKTGTTDAAGESYIGMVRQDNGKRFVVILLNSPDRFAEAKVALWWLLNK